MNENPAAFFELVKLLEEQVGGLRSYKILQPFPCNFLVDGKPSVIAVQDAAKIIANNVGLGHLVFIVVWAQQAKDTAGHIELDHSSREVFIELSPDLCKRPEAVLTTISHEISHKFLHFHGIRVGHTSLEQEYLTDVTAVFLGMGKLMLNGCETITSEIQAQQTITRRLNIGYISKQCLAFVYLLTCVAREISPHEYREGLSKSSLTDLDLTARQYAPWFERQGVEGGDKGQFVSELNDDLFALQDPLARQESLLRYIRTKLDMIESGLQRSHGKIYKSAQDIQRFPDNWRTPPLAFLAAVEFRRDIDAKNKMIESESQAQSELGRLEQLAALFAPSGDEGGSVVVSCPVDNTHLRVPSGKKRLIVSCAVCQYRFVAATVQPKISVNPSTAQLKRRNQLISRMKKVFRR